MRQTDKVTRFTITERLLHWSFALPQIVLMITGGCLLAASWHSGEGVAKTDLIRIHKIAAVCFLVVPLLVFIRGDAKTLLKNIGHAFSWDRTDLQWFSRSFKKIFVPSTTLPEVGKFNAGQKLNMLIVMALGILFTISGLVMWRFNGVLLAWIIHSAAFVAVLFIVVGHVYMAILHPPTRPSFWAIINGDVDREWANHHHPRWAKELDEKNTDEVKNA